MQPTQKYYWHKLEVLSLIQFSCIILIDFRELLASQEKMEQWVHRVTVDSEEKEDPLELMDHQDQPAARVSKERQVQRVHQAPKDHEEILDHRDRWEQLEREALLVRMVK